MLVSAETSEWPHFLRSLSHHNTLYTPCPPSHINFALILVASGVSARVGVYTCIESCLKW